MNRKLELQYDIEQWLYHEAELLDTFQFDAWLELLTEDVVYRMPIRVNVERFGEKDTSFDFFSFDDDRQTLQMRVDRLKTEFAWAEIPPSRTRRFVSNVRIKEERVDGGLEVFSNLLIYRSRGNEAEVEWISGERRDVFRKEHDQWKLARRIFLIDQTSMNTRNFAIFV